MTKQRKQLVLDESSVAYPNCCDSEQASFRLPTLTDFPRDEVYLPEGQSCRKKINALLALEPCNW